ncbi:MAG: NUDIX domain-containing protein [Oscillospiraceae bacterium]|nr:NUDIX domain-containing protein [Oscillospiraceae bacterium]
MKNEFFFAAKALLFCKDKFLIVKRSEKARGAHFFWEYPGGRLEFGEQPIEALRREIFEETGIKDLCVLGILNLWSRLKTPNTQLIGATYLCKTLSYNVKLSEEHTEYAWITKEELPEYNIYPSIKDDMSSWNWEEILKRIAEE